MSPISAMQQANQTPFHMYHHSMSQQSNNFHLTPLMNNVNNMYSFTGASPSSSMKSSSTYLSDIATPLTSSKHSTASCKVIDVNCEYNMITAQDLQGSFISEPWRNTYRFDYLRPEYCEHSFVEVFMGNTLDLAWVGQLHEYKKESSISHFQINFHIGDIKIYDVPLGRIRLTTHPLPRFVNMRHIVERQQAVDSPSKGSENNEDDTQENSASSSPVSLAIVAPTLQLPWLNTDLYSKVINVSSKVDVFLPETDTTPPIWTKGSIVKSYYIDPRTCVQKDYPLPESILFRPDNWQCANSWEKGNCVECNKMESSCPGLDGGYVRFRIAHEVAYFNGDTKEMATCPWFVVRERSYEQSLCHSNIRHHSMKINDFLVRKNSLSNTLACDNEPVYKNIKNYNKNVITSCLLGSFNPLYADDLLRHYNYPLIKKELAPVLAQNKIKTDEEESTHDETSLNKFEKSITISNEGLLEIDKVLEEKVSKITKPDNCPWIDTFYQRYALRMVRFYSRVLLFSVKFSYDDDEERCCEIVFLGTDHNSLVGVNYLNLLLTQTFNTIEFYERREKRLKLLKERKMKYKEDELEFIADDSLIGFIIGKQGEQLASVAKNNKVEIRVLPCDDEGFRRIRIYGSNRQNALKAKSEVDFRISSVHLTLELYRSLSNANYSVFKKLKDTFRLVSIYIEIVDTNDDDNKMFKDTSVVMAVANARKNPLKKQNALPYGTKEKPLLIVCGTSNSVAAIIDIFERSNQIGRLVSYNVCDNNKLYRKTMPNHRTSNRK